MKYFPESWPKGIEIFLLWDSAREGSATPKELTAGRFSHDPSFLFSQGILRNHKRAGQKTRQRTFKNTILHSINLGSGEKKSKGFLYLRLAVLLLAACLFKYHLIFLLAVCFLSNGFFSQVVTPYNDGIA